MDDLRYFGLAQLKREGWTIPFDPYGRPLNGGKSYPPVIRDIAEMIRKHSRRKTISQAMRDDAIAIFDMVKAAKDAE